MLKKSVYIICLIFPILLGDQLSAQTTNKEKTAFQTSREWKPVTDTRADIAIVYGVGGNPSDETKTMNFEDRVQSWRDRG